MKNVELKISVNGFSGISSLLRKAKARHVGETHQIDIYYYYENKRLKIRNINNKKFELILYKRPNITNVKISDYEVFSIKPSQVDCFRLLMEKIFKEHIVVEKSRDLWIYKKTRIHLDKVAKLGNFLELETVVNKDLKSAKKEFEKIFNLLNLKKYKKYAHSYSDLLLRKYDNSKRSKFNIGEIN